MMSSVAICRLAALSRLAVASRCHKSMFHTTSSVKSVNLDASTPLQFQEFEALRENKGALLIDVRQPEELLTDGKIPSSTNIPMGDLEKAFRMPADEFEQTYRTSKPHTSDAVVFFCKGGVRASEANDFARWLFQYSNTAFYSGIIDWKAKTGGSVASSKPCHPVTFEPSSPPLDFKTFESYRKGTSVTIIDVRLPEELVSDGEIPRAINIPMADLDSALRMSAVEFEKKYGAPQPQPEDPVIFICKIGVRAADARVHLRRVLNYNNSSTYSGILDWNLNMDKQ